VKVPTLHRRRFLLATAAGLAVAGVGYGWWRGVRPPLFHLARQGPVTTAAAGGVEVAARNASFRRIEDGVFQFRAFAPEPVLRAGGEAGRPGTIRIENIHPRAELAVSDWRGLRALDEKRDGLTRLVEVQAAPGARPAVSWRFPDARGFRFAAIGDSGGGTELEWVLARSAELGADFLLHLGDIHYEEGDFDRAERNLNAAAIPTYAAIGNHDFHKGMRALYPRFHEVVGPSNWIFRLGGIEFVNLDTAVDFYPAERGRRAQLLNGLASLGRDTTIRDRVTITHKPLRDPDDERDHAVDRAAERRWLRESLLARGSRHLLAGHIHIKAELDDQGLHTYVTGQGLAHADLIGEGPYRRYAEILIGDVEPGEPVRYRWQPLNMPFEMHCNQRNLELFDVLERPDVKARLMQSCGKA